MSLKNLQTMAVITPDGQFGPTTFKMCSKFIGLTSHARAVHFFAQTGHETGNFAAYTENLNYSSSALMSVFGKYFKDQKTADEYAKKAERIANRVYANRMGNGNEASGDGWKYRGRGALQLTGKDNYKAFSEYVKDPSVMTNPDLVASQYSFQSAMFFFDRNKLWSICDEGFSDKTIEKLTRKINGGTNGLAHRVELTKKYQTYKL